MTGAEQRAARDLALFAVEVPFLRKDGEVRWLHLRARPEAQPDGRIVWNGVGADITMVVADRERLRQSEATLRAAGDNLPDSVVYRYERDAAGKPRFLYISAGVEKLTGVTVEEAMADARALYAQVLPEYLPKLLKAEQAEQHNPTDFAIEVPIRRRDGEIRWMRLHARPEAQRDGRFVWNGVWTDITESVADREKLRQSEAMLRAIGDNLPDSAIYRFTRNTAGNPKYLYISAGVERLAGVTVEEALADARAVLGLILPEYLPMLWAAEAAATRDLTDVAADVPIRRKDGELRWVRLHSRPERQSNGVIVHNGVATDITESVADREKLRQSEAMLRAIGDNLPDSIVYQFTRDAARQPKFLYISAASKSLLALRSKRRWPTQARCTRCCCRNIGKSCSRLNKPRCAT